MALAALPFTALPSWAGRGAWLLVNVACLWLMVRWAWTLAGGGRLQGNASAGWGEHGPAVAGFLCGIFYLLNCLAHQQTDVVIGALLLGGCLALARTRTFLAATCFGLAAAMKCTALLWIPYLVWRGKARAAIWLLAVAFGVNFLPDLVNRSPSGRPWLAEYADRFLRPMTTASYTPGNWGSDLVVYNQSLSGAANRWLRTTWVWGPTNCEPVPQASPAGPEVVRGLVYSLEALLLLATALALGRPFQPLRDRPDELPGRLALESSVVLLLMLLLSPMSSKAHFGVMLLPGFCLARAARATRSPFPAVVLGAALTTALLSNKEPLGERLYTLTLWYGSVTWNALFLLAGCGWLLWREREKALGEETTPLAQAEWTRAA
jgi:hypothetical protein